MVINTPCTFTIISESIEAYILYGTTFTSLFFAELFSELQLQHSTTQNIER